MLIKVGDVDRKETIWNVGLLLSLIIDKSPLEITFSSFDFPSKHGLLAPSVLDS